MVCKHKKTLLPLFFFLFLLAALLSLLLGASSISPLELLSGLWQKESLAGRIFWYVRLPRTLTTLLCGAALAVSGAVLQQVLHNPLAGPNIIGLNGGAGFGAVLCLWLFPTAASSLLGTFAFLGALSAVVLVYSLGKLSGSSRLSLILSGVAVNAFANAAIDAVTTLKPDVLLSGSQFKIGGAAHVSASAVTFLLIVVPLCVVSLYLLRNALSVLTLGDEIAQSLGLRPQLFRGVFLLLSCLLAASAVSVMGLIGFVGLLVPHFVRLLSRQEDSLYLPTCTLCGGMFLTLCDLLSRLLFAPFELPVGILLSFLGVPFFLLLLVRRRYHD